MISAIDYYLFYLSYFLFWYYYLFNYRYDYFYTKYDNVNLLIKSSVKIRVKKSLKRL